MSTETTNATEIPGLLKLIPQLGRLVDALPRDNPLRPAVTRLLEDARLRAEGRTAVYTFQFSETLADSIREIAHEADLETPLHRRNSPDLVIAKAVADASDAARFGPYETGWDNDGYRCHHDCMENMAAALTMADIGPVGNDNKTAWRDTWHTHYSNIPKPEPLSEDPVDYYVEDEHRLPPHPKSPGSYAAPKEAQP